MGSPTASEHLKVLQVQWGARVAAGRKRLGMSQTALAAAAGISAQAMWGIESGNAAPKDTTRIAIAEALGVKVEDLFSYDATAVAS